MTDNEKELLKLYIEQTWLEMRHVEELRSQVSSTLITLNSAILGFIIQQKLGDYTEYMALLVIFLGMYGILFTYKQYVLHSWDQTRLNKWNEYWNQECGLDSKVLEIRYNADREHTKNFPFFSGGVMTEEGEFKEGKIKSHWFWTGIHLFVAILGLTILIVKLLI